MKINLGKIFLLLVMLSYVLADNRKTNAVSLRKQSSRHATGKLHEKIGVKHLFSAQSSNVHTKSVGATTTAGTSSVGQPEIGFNYYHPEINVKQFMESQPIKMVCYIRKEGNSIIGLLDQKMESAGGYQAVNNPFIWEAELTESKYTLWYRRVKPQDVPGDNENCMCAEPTDKEMNIAKLIKTIESYCLAQGEFNPNTNNSDYFAGFLYHHITGKYPPSGLTAENTDCIKQEQDSASTGDYSMGVLPGSPAAFKYTSLDFMETPTLQNKQTGEYVDATCKAVSKPAEEPKRRVLASAA